MMIKFYDGFQSFSGELYRLVNILVYSRAKKSVPLLIFVKIGTKVDFIIPNSMITFV